MKILIISTCNLKIHELEFVRPIHDIIKYHNKKNKITCEIKIINFKDIGNFNDISLYKKVIITGTALKDNEFLNHIKKFEFIKKSNSSILGICAGFQIICLLFKSKIIKCQEIGFIDEVIKINNDPILKDVNLNSAFGLHQNSASIPKEFKIIAKNKNSAQIIKNDKIYAVLFHPEVRQKKMIENFFNL